ncbi:MAG: ABC transporter ATP-binding protein [Haloarculaceae archaeon]
MLAVDGLTHRYGDETAVDDVSFGIDDGELVALLGPSGCGKTTIVQGIAGHVRPTAGTVRLRGEDVTDDPPEARRVSLVFQRSTLYPHMTVGENVAYGLEARGFEPHRRAELVEEHLELVSLADRHDAYPSELSGGQQRRVELARALAPQPDVLLLDEPLSALDRTLRDQLRDEIARIQRETGVTTLYVTHDQEDAMALADRLVVMNDGTISATGRPRSLYESPPTPFVASFLGRSNTFPATVVDEQPLSLNVGNRVLTLDGAETTFSEGDTVSCYVRPEYLSIRAADPDGPAPTIRGDVTRVVDRGRRYDVWMQTAAEDELVVEQSSEPPAVGDTITVEVPPERLLLFGPETRDNTEAPSSQ